MHKHKRSPNELNLLSLKHDRVAKEMKWGHDWVKLPATSFEFIIQLEKFKPPK